jgi:hypothetical protein
VRPLSSLLSLELCAASDDGDCVYDLDRGARLLLSSPITVIIIEEEDPRR